MSLAQTSAQVQKCPNVLISPIHSAESLTTEFPLKTEAPLSLQIVPAAIWTLGFMMFLINVSYVMIYSLSSLYLNASLGVSTIWIGLLEGAVETVSYLMKLCSGVISDYLRRRKFLMVIGYTLTVLSKPILAISGSFFIVFTARLLERIGNGIQSTPRDAMVTDIAHPQHRGLGFGLMRAMGTAGSCLGGILGYYAMCWTSSNFQQVFWIACVPAFFAICILIFFVKEPQKNIDISSAKNKANRRPMKVSDIFLLGKNYWILMIVVAVFMLARVSETLMVLHAHNNFGLDKTCVPLIMSMYNSTYSISSYASGWLSDKFGRQSVLMFGIMALVISDLCLATATDLSGVFIGVFIWGIQMGVSQNTFMSMIADIVPADLRGTGFGFYNLISAVSALVAGVGGGSIAHHYGVGSAFFISMLVAIASLVTLIFFMHKSQKEIAIAADKQ